MDFLANYGLFLMKLLTFIVGVIALVVICIGLGRNQTDAPEQIKLKQLNKYYRKLKQRLQKQILPKDELKTQQKADKQQQKSESKLKKPTIYTTHFLGNIRADAVSSLREVITAILLLAKPRDEVVITLESPGGMVPHYGLAASELARIKAAGLSLTVIIDKVAASGGYLMAVVADKIIAAPFAIVGSIGVVYQLPNFHRWLKRHDVDMELLTAGEYKRTLTLLGKNTTQGRHKVLEDLEVTHTLFKDFVHTHRPQVNIEEVGTGEYWYGTKAIELRMVDELMTSDDYLLAASERANIYQLSLAQKRSLGERFIGTLALALDTIKLSLQQKSDLPPL